MNWLSLWVNTFLKSGRMKYTFADGIKSVVFASVILGSLNFISAILVSTEGAAESFVSNLIVMPVLVLVCLFIFAAAFRWLASMEKGKGDFKKDCAAISIYLGSLIFVGGLVAFVLGLIMNASYGGASAADVNYFVMFVLMGLMVAALLCIGVTVFGRWLEELAAVEKLSVFTTGKVLGMATGLIVLVVLIITGALLELSLGPYKEMLTAYGSSGGVPVLE